MRRLQLLDEMRQQEVSGIQAGVSLALHIQERGLLQPPMKSWDDG